MWERCLVIAIAFGGVLLFDGFALRGKLTARDKLVYGSIVLITVYGAIDFAMNQDWPDYLDLANIPFGKAAKTMEQLLQTDWER
ncbi:hypothetical protein B1748_16955 [Paenibacillus sp. MY03]|uniref:hypothetical protein n=1 Tax=Paenibacillus sp. MY03 TaxID=302980 RepID=UPI000B3C406B|nr:hypothetical protein [Paenibacillus sp. MY03]OUS75548.1 hypothetical protein B1748_16955 [Paenibacillus sp. MY03]